MYRKSSKQISLFEFGQKAGLHLNPDNRWVKMAHLIDWDDLEEEYKSLYCPDNGAPAKPIRLAIGALLIKQIEGLPDEKLVQHLQENPYMQYFCGIKEFSYKEPFVPSLMLEFRKRFSEDVISEINERIFMPKPPKDKDDGDDDGNSGPPNKGTIILDATCTPANIKYPQDINLCNEAREKTEAMVEAMHAVNRGQKAKPRMDKKAARKAYLQVAKQKKRNPKILRKAIKKQLAYIKRNLSHIGKLIDDGHFDRLSHKQKSELGTIRKLYEQQLEMIKERKHSVEDRIVSISQPHVRPIVRGKAVSPVEFGAKVAISVIGGYAFTDNISWDAYNESGDLVDVVKRYRQRFGYYPEAVIVDKVYRNRGNLRFCKEHGIRISGPRLGRPRAGDFASKQQYKDSCTRNTVEGKFGIGKAAYGLGRVMANLRMTANTVINLAFLAMNLVKRLYLFFFFSKDRIFVALLAF
jgi:hypothetical protein